MKRVSTLPSLYSGLFWLTFAAMLTAMFGMRGPAPQHFATICAALLLLTGLLSPCVRRRTR